MDSAWFRLLCAIAGLAIAAAWVYTLVGPSEEAVRVRSALITKLGTPKDFAWTPDRVPESFVANVHEAPASFERIVAALGSGVAASEGDELAKALAIARHLMSAPRRVDGPIRSDTMSSYRSIVGEGRGYCADFTQVFNGLAIAGGLPVREWTIAFEGFGPVHTFNEVFDTGLGKWVLVDSFHSLYFVDGTNSPLSVREVHDRLLGIVPDQGLSIRRIAADRFPFRSEALALDYYRRGMSQLALSWGNNVFDYDRSRLVRIAGGVSRSLGQLVAIGIGVYPEAKAYPIGMSQRDFDSLQRTLDRLLAALVSLFVALLLFGMLILAELRSLGGSRPRSREPV